MSYEERHLVPGSQPYIRGHFPGNPIVPAVIILDLVLATIRRWKGAVSITSLPYARFKTPLHPDVPFTIRLHEIGDTAIGFECKSDDQVLAVGRAELSPSADNELGAARKNAKTRAVEESCSPEED